MSTKEINTAAVPATVTAPAPAPATRKRTVGERIMIEEFNEVYANTGKLRVAILNNPRFQNLTAVTQFTDDDKIAYIRVIRFTRQLVAHKKAALAGIVPLLDLDGDGAFIIPQGITRAYVDAVYSRTCANK